MRNYFNDKTSIEKYFKDDTQIMPAYKKSLRERCGMSDAAIEAVGETELARMALGFENYTEVASYVGLNITRSLVFSAGAQNPQMRTRIQSMAVLVSVGCAGAVGKQDDETAGQVYNAIMGGQYR